MLKGKKKLISNRLNKLFYLISLQTGVMAFFSYVIAFYLGLTSLAYYHLITFILYIYFAYLSNKGELYYSRFFFFIFLNIGITATASFIGRAGSVEYLFLFSLALPFLVFSFKSEKKYV